MKRILIYTWLQFKRAARFFPYILIFSLLICFALGFVLNLLISADTSAEKNQKVKIGLVGDTDDEYLGFGFTAIQSLDISRYSMELIEMSEDEAKRKLNRGELAAYLVIPEGFVRSVVSGDIKPISYVTTAASADIATLFKDEILSAISCMFVESQKGVYALMESMRENGASGISKEVDALNGEYFALILNRSSVFKTEIIGVSDSLSFGGYMLCGITVLLMLLSGISCASLFIKKDMALSKLLNANRHPAALQIMGEYASYFLTMYVNFSAVLTITFLLVGDGISVIPELQDTSPMWLTGLLLRLIPVVLAITSMQFFLYEITTGLVSGVLLQFLSALVLGYISGCLYPIRFFPEIIQKISAFTPSGLARGYLAAFLSENSSSALLIALLLYSAFFFAASAWMRKEKIARA